jgi:hypothetical protein
MTNNDYLSLGQYPSSSELKTHDLVLFGRSTMSADVGSSKLNPRRSEVLKRGEILPADIDPDDEAERVNNDPT